MSEISDIANEYGRRCLRLYEVAEFAAAIPDDQFTMEHWWLPDGEAFDDERNRMYRVKDGPCGDIVGHMCKLGMYGLTLDDVKNERQRVFVIVGDTFEMSYKIAEFLFDQYSYPDHGRNRELLVARIKFVADELRYRLQLRGLLPEHTK